MNRLFGSGRRLGLMAAHTVREALRQRLLPVVALAAAGLVLGASCLRELHFGSSELKFVAELGGAAIALFGAVLAVVATAQLFLGDIERRTALTLLAGPVGRAEFAVGKFAGVAVVTGGFCAGLTFVLAGVLRARETAILAAMPEPVDPGGWMDYGRLAWAGLGHWLALLEVSALTLFVASYARTQLFATAMGFLLFAVGHLQHVAHAASVRAGRPGLALLWRMVPDLSVYTLVPIGSSGGIPSPGTVAAAWACGLAHVALAGGLAVWIFQRREL